MQSHIFYIPLGLRRFIRFAVDRHLLKGLFLWGALAIASPTRPVCTQKQDAHQRRANHHNLVAMSFSDDDVPLARSNKSNGLSNGLTWFLFSRLLTFILVSLAGCVA